MNLGNNHNSEKAVSTSPLFKGTEGQIISIRIKAGEQLKEHITKVPAIIVCITGNAVYNSEKNEQVPLKPGDYHPIEPFVKHWIDADEDSLFLLAK